jgi:hypothetical protein
LFATIITLILDIDSEYKLEKEAAETGEFILFIDQLFDSLNGNSKISQKSKPLKGGVTRNSGHEKFWKDSIKLLEKISFWDEDKRKLVKVPSLQNLIKTLRGFIYLKYVLLQKLEYFLLRAFNQDCLENFFASIRSHGVRYTSPDVSHFVTSFKSLIVNNFLKTRSLGSNCEDDFSTGALDNLRCFLTGEEIAGVHPLQSNGEDISQGAPGSIGTIKKSRVAKSTIAYVAGFVAKKVLKLNNQCDSCKQTSFDVFRRKR